ncbi:MAG: NAD-dependent epimerase/dehydratase family protein [Chloroflexota bacterium]|nr:NAD-dependent epimerase/dehydratase family protein [Chloroflexota bacterium]
MTNPQDVINLDLEYICCNLVEEFACLSGQRLLITGGAGFLGYYLVQAALYWNTRIGKAQNIQLAVYDNYIRGVPDWLTKLEGDKNLTLVEHDITNPLPQNIGDFQYIIHAASIASPTYYRMHPIETMDANVNGLRFLLEYCREQAERDNPVEGFMFFSSSEIYGDPSPENIPTPENYWGNVSCTGPRACYDESKRYGETLCVNFARQYDLPIKIARPFNNYGPGLKITDRRVLPDFARDVLAGRDIVMLSDGSPTRTFCYVADAIVGYYKILVKGRNGEAYNIGVEEPEISMADLAERVVGIAGELFDYEGKVVRQASPDQDYLIDNPNRRCPMIAKARADLGYNPSISLDEGLRRSLIWYYDNRDAEEA